MGILLASTLWLSTLDSFRGHYSSLSRGGVGSAVRMLPSLLCGEFFFRGFLILPLFAKFRRYALLIAVMPYSMIHIGKPLIELFGSIVFGLGLSYLAVRSGSILYGTVTNQASGM